MVTTVFHVLVETQYTLELDKALVGKALNGYAFRNLTMKKIAECIFACVEDCVCMAFQSCGENTECQLLSSNQFETPSALVTMKGCSYYDMIPEKIQQVDKRSPLTSCTPSCNCQVNPCQHGGSCEEIVPKDNKTPRYKCICLPGYAGDHCQDVVKSCRGYINGSRLPGNYTVFDDNMNLFKVFCDFDSNSTMTWTLIESYQLQNKANFDTPFSEDFFIHENTPRWDAYRLSKSRMKSIQAYDSTKWRITCKYEADGVVYRDYLQASNKQVDILTFNADRCMLVERIDIRGHSCYQCTAHLIQNGYGLHSDSYYPTIKGCQFQPGGRHCGGSGEDNFGAYNCISPDHRCSTNAAATTQTWFGGD